MANYLAELVLISHLFKIALFGIVGFAYVDYLLVMAFMVLGAVFGSWVGTRMRLKVPNRQYVKWLNWLLSGLALNMIIGVLMVS